MEQLSRIRSLLIFLRSGRPSIDEILKFICLDTLYEYSALQVHLSIAHSDGTVNIPYGYGCDPELLRLVPPLSVSVDTPFNRYLRTGEIGPLGNFESFSFSRSDQASKIFPMGFEFSFLWPIPGVGAVVTFCSREINLTIREEEFLLIIGSILSLEIARNFDKEVQSAPSKDAGFVADHVLTKRQWEVVAGIIAGKSNLEISKDLGFSESLIRQETVQIYSKMGVTGRKEIQMREAEFRQEKSPS